MLDYSGKPNFPIWLIADSEPERWHRVLETPLDPRHPARHSIWTSVFDYMQKELYKQKGLRFDDENVYIRNAIKRANDKPKAEEIEWSSNLQTQLDVLSRNIERYSPVIILTFGAFAFEFVRRALGEQKIHRFSYWGTEQLGKEFRERYKRVDPDRTNVLPLLHVSISRGKFLESHSYFIGDAKEETNNYFEYVGMKLANLLLERMLSRPIWLNKPK